jgi:hypothetical protein
LSTHRADAFGAGLGINKLISPPTPFLALSALPEFQQDAITYHIDQNGGFARPRGDSGAV